MWEVFHFRYNRLLNGKGRVTITKTAPTERSFTDSGLIPGLLFCHTHDRARPIVDDNEVISEDMANAWAILLNTLLQNYSFASAHAARWNEQAWRIACCTH
jgi:hypothetical protein